MGKVEVWCEWCRKPVLVAEAHIDELETSLTIANTTAANLHDVIRDKGKRIAELEKELYEWVGWAQTMLKVVKGNKIVHGSLGGELECAITSRIAELEREKQAEKNYASRLQARVKDLESELATTKLELAVAKDSADKWFTKCRAAEAELAASYQAFQDEYARHIRLCTENVAENRKLESELAHERETPCSGCYVRDEEVTHLRACLKRLLDHAMDHSVFCPCSHGSIMELRKACDESAKELKEGE